MARFKIEALPSQVRAHQLKTKYRGFSGPVGSGKSWWLCDHLLMLAYKNSGRTGLLGSPTYPMLRDATLPTMFERLEHHGIPYRYYKSDKVILLKEPQTRLLCRAVEKFNRLRGTNLAFFGIDETSYCPELAWKQLEARLRDPLAKELAGCGAWTPKGHDWLYRRFIKRPILGHKAVLANPMENTHLDASFYPSLLASYSANFARQEVLGEYLNVFSGRAYDAFDNETGGSIYKRDSAANHPGMNPCLFQPERPILWSLDFNINPATSVIGQSVLRPDKYRPSVQHTSALSGDQFQLNILDELYLPNTNTLAHCEAFYERLKPRFERGRRIHVVCFGDASGARRQSSASKSDYAIIDEFFVRHSDVFTFERRIPAQNPLVKDRINSVNALLQNYNGDRRLAVHERCKELIQDLEQVAWALDTTGNQLPVLAAKDPLRGHISDALGYMIWELFGIRGKVGEVKAGIVC